MQKLSHLPVNRKYLDSIPRRVKAFLFLPKIFFIFVKCKCSHYAFNEKSPAYTISDNLNLYLKHKEILTDDSLTFLYVEVTRVLNLYLLGCVLSIPRHLVTGTFIISLSANKVSPILPLYPIIWYCSSSSNCWKFSSDSTKFIELSNYKNI